jgi:hypothetical protein
MYIIRMMHAEVQRVRENERERERERGREKGNLERM